MKFNFKAGYLHWGRSHLYLQIKDYFSRFIPPNKGVSNPDDVPQFESLMSDMRWLEPGQKNLSLSDVTCTYKMDIVTHVDSHIWPTGEESGKHSSSTKPFIYK